jgi:hypothetical protein
MSKAVSSPSGSAPSRRTRHLRIRGTINVVLALIVAGCGTEDGSSGSGTGGLPASGGVVGSGGTAAPTGGTQAAATGGTVATGGSGGAATSGAATGGTIGNGATTSKAGTAGAGGSAPGGGTAGKSSSGGGGATGGSMSNGGTAGTAAGGPSGGAMSGGAGTGGGGSGTCAKGTTKGNEVLFIGESFIAASSIPEETTKLARAAGSLGASDSYVDKSVSGTWIGNGQIPTQYKSNSSGVRFVLMNGGGNDCWQGGQESHRTAALSAAKTLFQDMATNGVEQVVYFFYPDPIGAQFANLTACLDLLRPDMKAVCDAQTKPKCNWVDLRDTWNGHPEYTSDGIHVAGPGNVPTAGAIFKSMQANCVAP